PNGATNAGTEDSQCRCRGDSRLSGSAHRQIIGHPTVIATGSGDPVASGLVASLARPGGNVTGLSDVATTLSTNGVSLLKELLPQLRRVARLWNKGDGGMSLRYEASAVAARELGVIVQPLGVSEPDDFIEAFDTMNRERPDAILTRIHRITH